MNFDIELAKKQSQENPVYYVQYVHARVSSIFREGRERKLQEDVLSLLEGKDGGERSPEQFAGEDLAGLTHPAERSLLMKLASFPEALRTCERELSPHPLPNYLLELAGLFHPFYEQCRVLDKDQPGLTRARLTLCAGVRAAIADGLGLLGVSAPERM